MKERGILFQGPMTRALLADTKTQTRRAVKWRDVSPSLNLGFSGLQAVNQDARGWVLTSMGGSCWEERCAPTPCPYGQAGDRLWVRETFWAFGRWVTQFSAKKGRDEWHFDDLTTSVDRLYQFADPTPDARRHRASATPAWWKRPAIHMPRAASRILLENIAVRVEHLQAISAADALAEGIVQLCDLGFGLDRGEHYHAADPRQSYFSLWEAINGPGSVEANPWVWAVSFRRIA